MQNDALSPFNPPFIIFLLSGSVVSVAIVVSYGRCLLLLLRIRSAHLEILRFPIGDAYQDSDIFARFKPIRRK